MLTLAFKFDDACTHITFHYVLSSFKSVILHKVRVFIVLLLQEKVSVAAK